MKWPKYAAIGAVLTVAVGFLNHYDLIPVTWAQFMQADKRITALEDLERGRVYDELLRRLKSNGELSRGEMSKLCNLAVVLYLDPKVNDERVCR